jgi:nitric oxide reductase NorE protein
VSSDADLPYFLGGPPEASVAAAEMPTAPPVPPDPRVPGEPGLWVFLLGDMTVFGAFFVGVGVYRLAQPEVFRASAAHLVPGLGALNTVVLLTSSLLMATAVRALRAGRGVAVVRRLLAGVLGCAIVFAAVKAVEYVGLVRDGHTPSSDVFFTLYFALTGIHLLHLVVGAGLVAGLVRVLSTGPEPWSRLAFTRGVASYWHMVDLLWVVLFPLLYLVAAA